jgi:hypothetical protein
MIDDVQSRMRALEIALDCLLAEIEELRNRLETHALVCPALEISLD